MSITRRALLKAGASAAALAAVPRPLLVRLGRAPEPVPPIEDPRLRDLAFRGVEAARAAGASYADVRLTHTRIRRVSALTAGDGEVMAVGVRAFVQGYWGFAAGPLWSADEMARLGQEAAHEATANTLGKLRTADLAPAPRVVDGHWAMPIAIDPFELSPFEIQDFLASLILYVGNGHTQVPGAGILVRDATFVKQVEAFASSAGSYCTQILHRTSGLLNLQVTLNDGTSSSTGLPCLGPAGMGWELFSAARIPLVRDDSLREAIRITLEALREDLMLPRKPVEVGRFDAVMDQWSVAQLLDQTLGRATELDRALGYEANAHGTSYMNEPLAMLGSYQAGAPILTVTGERSTPGALATVKWDAEGVVPEEFALVKEGVLTDFQTTRESAGWLRDYYARAGEALRSHGCASAASALDAPLTRTPNLALQPGRDARDFDALVSELGAGIAVTGLAPDTDFQALNGLGLGRVYEVKGGRRVAHVDGAGILFRAPELWKELHRVGGAESARRYAMVTTKGEPEQTCYHSVTVPPAAFKQLTVIEVGRKA